MIVISNDEHGTKSTSYWNSQYVRLGKFIITGNAGAWRLLLPDTLKNVLPECATAKWVEFHKRPAFSDVNWRIVFEDKSSAPFCLTTVSAAITPTPVLTRKKSKPPFYTCEGLQKTHQVRCVIKKGYIF